MDELIVEGGPCPGAGWRAALSSRSEAAHPGNRRRQHGGDEMARTTGSTCQPLGRQAAKPRSSRPRPAPATGGGGEIVELDARPGAAGPKTGDGGGHQQRVATPKPMRRCRHCPPARRGRVRRVARSGPQGTGVSVEGAPGGELGAAGVALEQLAAKFPSRRRICLLRPTG